MKLIIEIFLFFCPFFSFSSFKAGYHSGYNLCEWVVCGHLEESVFWSFIGWSVLEISTGSDIFQFFNVFFNSLLFILVLGFELRALLLDPHPQPFSLALFFGIGSWVYVWAGLDLDQSYLCVPQSWDDRYTPPQPAAYWLRWGLKDFLLRLTSNRDPLEPGSQETGITGMSHHTNQSHLFSFFSFLLCVCVCACFCQLPRKNSRAQLSLCFAPVPFRHHFRTSVVKVCCEVWTRRVVSPRESTLYYYVTALIIAMDFLLCLMLALESSWLVFIHAMVWI
jgi:hypothetical protein